MVIRDPSPLIPSISRFGVVVVVAAVAVWWIRRRRRQAARGRGARGPSPRRGTMTLLPASAASSEGPGRGKRRPSTAAA